MTKFREILRLQSQGVSGRGMAACRNRLPDLLDELAVPWGEGVYKKVMKQYKKVSLLILDEWLLIPMKDTQAMDLLEIVEARCFYYLLHPVCSSRLA